MTIEMKPLSVKREPHANTSEAQDRSGLESELIEGRDCPLGQGHD